MKLRFTETALAETRSILDYVAKNNDAAADKVAAAIDRTLAWIGRWPKAPPVVFGDDVRAKLVSGYQIRIFFSVDDDGSSSATCAAPDA